MQTKKLGFNGIMVEVQNAEVLKVSEPNRDTDFDVIISGSTVSSFKTENVRFPRCRHPIKYKTRRSGIPSTLLELPFFDFTHWEIHPIFRLAASEPETD